jgi:transposase
MTESERLAIVRMSAEGMSQRDIAASIGCSKTGVQKIIKKANQQGTIKNMKRTGRKRITTPGEDRYIVMQAKKDPSLSGEQICETVAQTGVTASPKTVKRRIKEAGLSSCVQRGKPMLTPTQAKRRLDFARKYVNKPAEFWRKVIFSDESKFELISNKRKTRVWRHKGEEFMRRMVKGKVKHSKYVMVWGCFSWYGCGSLVFIRERMTQYVYVDIINDHIMTDAMNMGISDDFIFQQDNDPKHTAKYTQSYFAEVMLVLLEWPSNSPDLNPIEHLWDELDRMIPKSKRKNMKDFEAALLEAWASIGQDVIHKLIESMPRRLAAVIKARGYHTRY